MPRGRHHPGDPSRRWTLASCRRIRRLGPAAPRCPLGHDPQAAFEPGRAQTAPELGAVPAPGGPFPLKARQPRLETALADAEHVLALAADDLAHELAAQPRQANDPLEGDTISGHLADHPVGVLPAQETLVLQALGGSQNLRIELLRPDRLAESGSACRTAARKAAPEFSSRCHLSATCTAFGKARATAPRYPPFRSRATTSIWGCRLSQASTVAGSRSGRRSMTRRRSRSQINVP